MRGVAKICGKLVQPYLSGAQHTQEIDLNTCFTRERAGINYEYQYVEGNELKFSPECVQFDPKHESPFSLREAVYLAMMHV